MDERDEIGVEQQAAVTTRPTYSVYEPHYQQMHPLIYYEDTTGTHHAHPHILGPAVPHHWDQEHFVHMPMIPFGDTSTRACLNVGYNQPTASSSLSSTSTAPCPAVTSAETTTASAPIFATTIAKTQATTTTTVASNAPSPPARSEQDGGCRQNQPMPTNREMHNEIERRRRLRIKQCCDVLRTLVPGLTDKTDKATVLEHTVKFVSHLAKCPNLKCNCEH